jgi:hypothetical protein
VEQLDRRTLAKAGITSLPIIALADVAPAFAASGEPTCPTCLGANAGAFTEEIIVAGGRSTFATLGTLAFSLDSSACNISLFQPVYTILGNDVTVTYNTGANQTFGSAAITGSGTFGAISSFTASFSLPTTSIAMPDDAFLPYTPVYPTSITIKFTPIFIGITGISVSCPYTASFSLTTANTGSVVLGTGSVNYTGIASGGAISNG